MKLLIVLLLTCATACAQLDVTVSPPQLGGQKAVVRLDMANNLEKKVESARAVLFLIDEHGKMICQGTHWVIGGGNGNAGLDPGATNIFNFVLTNPRPFQTTNLTPKLTFTRIILSGGTLADPNKDAIVKSVK